MKILYGCCYKADLEMPNVYYVDIIPNLKKSKNCKYICKDIKEINFKKFDVIICTPPCNYYSKCNYRRETSKYAQLTKDLLPYCINAANKTNKPFIIENVRNPNIFKKEGIYSLCNKLGIYIYTHGRHTYFTNIMIDLSGVEQRQDFKIGGYVIKYSDMNNKEHQGGYNVNNVIKYFIKYVTKEVK